MLEGEEALSQNSTKFRSTTAVITLPSIPSTLLTAPYFTMVNLHCGVSHNYYHNYSDIIHFSAAATLCLWRIAVFPPLELQPNFSCVAV